MGELTFAQLDALAAEREAKRRELIESLARLFSKSFTYEELRLIQYDPASPPGSSAILIEAFEIARTKARR